MTRAHYNWQNFFYVDSATENYAVIKMFQYERPFTFIAIGPPLTGTFEPEVLLVNGLHYESECTSRGGEVVYDGPDNFCRLDSSSCPQSWVMFGGWSTTVGRICQDGGCNSCEVIGHSWADIAGVDTCGYDSEVDDEIFCISHGYTAPCCYPYFTCRATITQIGCY